MVKKTNEKRNILKLLIEQEEEEISIRQISVKRKVNYKSAYNAIQKLKSEGIIICKRHGNTISCTFNRKFNELVFTVEYQRLQELLKNKNFKVLYNNFAAVNQQFILLLFGSHAKKTQSKHSDIDILLISDHPEEIKTQVKLLPLPIHLTHITYADFLTMLKSKEFTVVSEAIKKNIIFFGVEDYYRMINNA